MLGFLKYEFNNKLLSDVTLFKITLSVTWILYIYIYIWGQDLSTVFRCCSLDFPFKILSYRFFLMGWKCIF